MKKCVFSGLCTALVTPMREGRVDTETLAELVDWQITQGVDALLFCGTTGEAATLSAREKKEVITEGIRAVGGRVPVVVGCGTNDTASTVAWAAFARQAGADATLLVTPYYNKGTEEGVVAHFLRVAERVDMPHLLYHVPGRTGVKLKVSQMALLAEADNLVGWKEADPDVDRVWDIREAVGDRLALYSGNDSLTIPLLSMGGMGTISVISNILPAEMGDMIRLWKQGKQAAARRVQLRLLPLMRALFAETNPAPVKYALSRCGFGTSETRLPMTPPSEALRRRLDELMGLL